jgi:hypothetical protein
VKDLKQPYLNSESGWLQRLRLFWLNLKENWAGDGGIVLMVDHFFRLDAKRGSPETTVACDVSSSVTT